MTERRRGPAGSPETVTDERRSTSGPAPDAAPEAPDAASSAKGAEPAKKRARKRRPPFVL